MTTWPIHLTDVLTAREHLRPTPPTALRSYPVLDEVVGCGIHVLVKHENFQPTGAFKVRSGLSALSGLGPERGRRGVVAATLGIMASVWRGPVRGSACR